MSGAADRSGLAGTLRQRVAIERPAAARDALGSVAGWDAAGEAAAAIAPDAWGAAAAGEALAGMARWRVTLRAQTDVRVGDRLVWGARRIAVLRRLDDPRLPDRIVVFGEEER